jgi:epoxyqueuosine reductase
MRCGSIVVNTELEPTERKVAGIRGSCLYYTKGTCKRRVARCPVAAISEKGHDKDKCHSYASVEMNEYSKTHYGLDTYGCGLCQTGVPCESRIPREADLQSL